MKVILIGLLAGVMSGLLGVGDGIVMFPLLVMIVGFGQHRAHAVSRRVELCWTFL